MNINEIVLDKSEIRRYAGYKQKNKIIEELEDKIDYLISEVKKTARVKYTYELFDINILNDRVSFADVVFKSKYLAKNLDTCHKVIILSATLGNEIDMLIRRYSLTDNTSMVFVQAIATEYLEKIIDEIENDIIANSKEQIFLKPRFSPGYSDLDISHQKDFISILNTPKKIGLSITNSNMLTPMKSVTAIIGITKTNFRAKNKCCSCSASNCEFRE